MLGGIFGCMIWREFLGNGFGRRRSFCLPGADSGCGQSGRSFSSLFEFSVCCTAVFVSKMMFAERMCWQQTQILRSVGLARTRFEGRNFFRPSCDVIFLQRCLDLRQDGIRSTCTHTLYVRFLFFPCANLNIISGWSYSKDGESFLVVLESPYTSCCSAPSTRRTVRFRTWTVFRFFARGPCF